MANSENPPLKKMFAEFAQYLIEYKKTGKEDDEEEAEILADEEEDDDEGDREEEIETAREPYNGLKPKVILQYFTTMKARFFSRFEPLAFKGPSPTWYTRLHASLKLRVAADCLVRGGKMTKKAVGFGREVLIEICDYLMNQEDEALGCEERCIIALLYAAVGRGGEVSFTTWNSARWDKAREHLAFDWGEKKKGAQYLMTFHPDSTDWRVDVIHALACYVLCGQGGGKAPTSPQESGVHWLFGSYVGMAEGGAASKVSRILEKCRNGGVDGVPADSNSHGVRVGATDEMIFNHMVSVFAAIARGGWDFKADSTLFHYFTQELHVSQGGKALANWSNPNMHVSAPTLKAITDENDDVERFCKALFASADIPGINSELVDVRNVMVATLLRYFDDVYNEMKKGRDSLLILTLHNAAIACEIDFGTIRDWGKEVKEDFITKNAQNFGNSTGSDSERISKALTILQESCSNLHERQKRQEAMIKTLLKKSENQDDRMDKMTKLLETVLTNQACMSSGIDTLIHQLCPPSTPSPTHPSKKRKASTPEVAAATAATTPADANEARTTSTTSTKTVDEVITAPKRTILWEALLRKMPCDQFVQEVMWCNVTFHANHFLPAMGTDSKDRKDKLRKLRLIAKAVFDGMEEVAEGDEKHIFLRSKVPRGGDAHTEWLEHVKKTASTVAIRYAKSVIRRQLVAEDKYTEANFLSIFNNQKMTVGSVYSKLEKTLQFEKNKRSSTA